MAVDHAGNGDAGVASAAGASGAAAMGGTAGGVNAATPAAGAAGATAADGGSYSANDAAVSGADAASEASDLPHFSFFVTSYMAMQFLSGTEEGFGGDLRFGKADGLSGADEICRQIAETSMRGSSSKGWRAFLSVTMGPDGQPVDAIDRIGEGPWYDRLGRLVAANTADLAQTRPLGADPAIINDLPNEDGVPNHAPAPDGVPVDNHDVLTGSDSTGRLYSSNWSSTCHDWTSAVPSDGKPRVGHSWPRMGSGGAMRGGGGMDNWMSALDEAGCGAGASLVEMGAPDPSNPTVGSGGGYGGIYCFALKP